MRASCLLATGFQAFEVQLVLRQALPDIWTVLRDQGVSSYLRAGCLSGPIFSHPTKSGLWKAFFLSSFPLLLVRWTTSLALFPGTQDSENLSLLLSQIIVKKVSKQHRWYLENTSCDRESCWKEKILLSARGFSVFFQMLVKAQKVGKKNLFSCSLAVLCIPWDKWFFLVHNWLSGSSLASPKLMS